MLLSVVCGVVVILGRDVVREREPLLVTINEPPRVSVIFKGATEIKSLCETKTRSLIHVAPSFNIVHETGTKTTAVITVQVNKMSKISRNKK